MDIKLRRTQTKVDKKLTATKTNVDIEQRRTQTKVDKKLTATQTNVDIKQRRTQTKIDGRKTKVVIKLSTTQTKVDIKLRRRKLSKAQALSSSPKTLEEIFNFNEVQMAARFTQSWEVMLR